MNSRVLVHLRLTWFPKLLRRSIQSNSTVREAILVASSMSRGRVRVRAPATMHKESMAEAAEWVSIGYAR